MGHSSDMEQWIKKNKKPLVIGLVAVCAYVIARKTFFKQEDPTGYVPGGTYSPGQSGYPSTQIQFDAAKVANQLYLAMKDMGTDESSIMSALRNVNESQFAQVIQAFGSKPYNTYLGNQQSFGFGLDSYELPFWLENELSTSEYNTLKLKYPNLLN